MPAEPGAHQFGPAAVRPQGFDGLRQRNGAVLGDRGALFGLAQAGAVGGIGGHGSTGKDGRRRQQSGKQHNRERSENRHERGCKRVPVNAG